MRIDDIVSLKKSEQQVLRKKIAAVVNRYCRTHPAKTHHDVWHGIYYQFAQQYFHPTGHCHIDLVQALDKLPELYQVACRYCQEK